MPEKKADAPSLRNTLSVSTYGTLHDVDHSLRYLLHGMSPERGRTPN